MLRYAQGVLKGRPLKTGGEYIIKMFQGELVAQFTNGSMARFYDDGSAPEPEPAPEPTVEVPDVTSKWRSLLPEMQRQFPGELQESAPVVEQPKLAIPPPPPKPKMRMRIMTTFIWNWREIYLLPLLQFDLEMDMIQFGWLGATVTIDFYRSE